MGRRAEVARDNAVGKFVQNDSKTGRKRSKQQKRHESGVCNPATTKENSER
jgi:hypothetical protein